jgi:L-lysine 2,3-aminomutase
MTSSTKLSKRRPWQDQLSGAISSIAELAEVLQLDIADLPGASAAVSQFPLRVPRAFVDKMQAGNPQDPLLLQVLPQASELDVSVGYSADPLHEATSMPVPGLLHKYQGRVLLTVVGACAVNCRYCFRRHYPYSERIPAQGFSAALDYIAADNSIKEVILSGGDPLLLKDAQLGALLQSIAAISHVQAIRIHTRTPVVMPARIDESFINLMRSIQRVHKVVVLHANHPCEIDTNLAAAVQSLRSADVTVLNQSVLLRGVNDNAGVLQDLSWRLFSAGVLPYYLHQMDKVAGAEHFAVPLVQARNIYRELQATLPGYLCPRWVVETPGAANKELCN